VRGDWLAARHLVRADPTFFFFFFVLFEFEDKNIILQLAKSSVMPRVNQRLAVKWIHLYIYVFHQMADNKNHSG